MGRMKKKTENRSESVKNKIIVVLSLICLLLSVFCVLLLMETKKVGYVSEAEDLGRDYYQNHLYAVVTAGMNDEEIQRFLSSNEEAGFRIRLDDALRAYSSEKDKLTLSVENAGCNLEEVWIYMFPENPYGFEDVSVIVKDNCEK